jgi:PAS domain S-box-containing protein
VGQDSVLPAVPRAALPECKTTMDFRLLFESAPGLFAVVLPDEPAFTIVAASEAYLQASRQSREQIIGRGLFEVFGGDDDPDHTVTLRNLRASFEQVLATGQPHSMPVQKYDLRRPGSDECDEHYWSPVNAPVLGARGEVELIIHRVEDVTESLKRRRDAEARESMTFAEAPIGMVLTTPEGRILEVNQAYLNMLGYSREELVARDSAPFTHPDDVAATRQFFASLHNGSRTTAAIEKRYIRKSGELLWARASAAMRRDERGRPTQLIAMIEDITERKALELRNDFLVRLDDATRPLTDPYEITQSAARMLGEYLQVNRCAYADVEDDEDTFNLTGDYNIGVPSIVGRYSFTQFGDECLRLMREGKPYVVEDSESDPRTIGVVESYRLTRIRAVICVPLRKAGRLAAAMAVHQMAPRQWRSDEVELLQQVASRCWEAIERTRVSRTLREREQHFRFLAESIPQMVWTATPDGMLSYVNGQGCEYFGVGQPALLGAGWLTGVHPEDQERTAEHWKHSLATSEPYDTSFRLRRGRDGAWRWHLVRATPLLAQDGSVVEWFGTCTDIEDQKQAEAKLRQQWKTFDTALSHTPDFTYIFDLEGRFKYVNRSLLALWQKSLDEAVGRNFFDLGYPPELAGRLQRQIQQVITTIQPVRDQTPFTGPTGETRYYEYIFVPILDAQGRVEAVAGSTRDITDRNQAAQQIEEDRRRWRELLLQTPAAIAILRGPEHRFEWVNADYIRLAGRPAVALVGKTLLEAMPEVEAQSYIELLNRVYLTGEPFVGHESLVRLDYGEASLRDVYVNFVYLATRDINGAIDGIFVHATDVTDMVIARKQVEERETQFRTLAETIPHLAWMADETGHIFWYNRRWYEYTGTTLPEMEGWGWQTVHDPNVLPEVLNQWRGAISSGEPFEMIFPLKGADGAFRSFLTRVEPVKDSSGHVVRWFGTNTDITEQRRIEEQLRRMNRELEEFAYVASHDLQEPLRMVNIYTHLILRTLGDSDGKLSEYSAFVRQGVTRMEALIHDLLAFSRTVHADEQSAATADLALSLSEAMSVLKNRIEESGAIITAGTLPCVRGDTDQMAHVFQNILSNALKYRKENVTPEIRISASLENDQWIVSVSDNGIGFDPKYSERIFGLFKRLHSNDYPGTGLGLAICKRIVERHGGRMWAESKPGEGAIFYFSAARP